MVPFIVFALPRSRTAWTTHYLRYKHFAVRHDAGTECAAIGDFFKNFDAGTVGCVETGTMIAWPLIRNVMPEAKFAVIRRPVNEVRRSLLQFNVVARAGELEERDAILHEIAAHPGVLSIDYRDLYLPSTRKALFEHCLQCEWDREWDDQIAPLNIQIDVRARLRYLVENRDRIEAIKAEIAEIATGMAA